MNWQEKFKSVLVEIENKNEEYRNFYEKIIDPSFEDIKDFLKENFPNFIIEINHYHNNKSYSEISIKVNKSHSFNYRVKIKETYMGKKILVKSSKVNEDKNPDYLEKDTNEEILLTKNYKEGPTIDVVKKEDLINDLINKFSIYQTSFYSKGLSIYVTM